MDTPLRALFVEDSACDAELLVHELERAGYTPVWRRVETAAAMAAALAEAAWDVVIADHSVGQFDSLGALEVLKASSQDIPFIIVSGTISEELAVEAMRAGASDYLVKDRLARFVPALERELRESADRRARRGAERATRDREQLALLELAAAYEATLAGWARALDLRDRETEGHSRRVSDLTLLLARKMGVGEADCVHIRRGALLHDIGKIAVPDQVLHKASPLTSEDWSIMRQHPTYAMKLLAPIEYLRPALDIPYCHHEKWDGTGYPRGLAGEDIPLAARIFAVVDIWDALRSDRPYRRRWPEAEVRGHLASLSGTHLDPSIVPAFLELLASGQLSAEFQEDTADSLPREVRARILVVDDYRPGARLLKRCLAGDGYDVVTADSGDVALRLIAQHQPDLVILDIDLPGPNGFAVCRCLRQAPDTSGIPVIFMSGLDPSANEIAASHLGAVGYLTKPVDVDALRTQVRLALTHGPAEARPREA